MEILSEYEQIFKLREFARDERLNVPYQNTYELLKNDLKTQYVENLDEKLDRWLSITKVPYFKNVFPVKYYFQAKMLFRDGFYEAAITVSRGICEMICHDILDNMVHPFGSEKELGEENFRTLVNFIAVPKEFEKNIFEKNILNEIDDLDDKNLVKSSYKFIKENQIYSFKVENGKKSKTSNRLLRIFEELAFDYKEIFKPETFKLIHKIYDLGNIYIHARKSSNAPKNDAFEMIDSIGFVLFELYGVKGFSMGDTLISGYSSFPDICTGVSYAIESASNLLDAPRIYHNLPSELRVNQFISACGTWEGEWVANSLKNKNGKLLLFIDDDCNHEGVCVHGKFIFFDGEEISNLVIQLFGNYFHIAGFKSEEKILHFELSFLNEHVILGKNLLTQGNVVFNKIV